MEIFGHLSPKVLSDLTHEFDFWKEHYKNSINPDRSYDKKKNIITIKDMMKEADKISNVFSFNKNQIFVIFGAYSKNKVFKLYNSTYFIFSKDV